MKRLPLINLAMMLACLLLVSACGIIIGTYNDRGEYEPSMYESIRDLEKSTRFHYYRKR
jgi:hypothetical protein